jgi:hypothetical protein
MHFRNIKLSVEGEHSLFHSLAHSLTHRLNHSLTILTGNEVIHEITTHSSHELRIDMEDFDGHSKYAKYSVFSVGDELGHTCIF